ncbi:MAG: amidase [Actinobacteria bacterium]|nr:amidase [Actinomycetota bacterium]
MSEEWLDAIDQADLVRRGEAKPVELVEAAIARIEASNPTLNAVIHPSFERAVEAAIEGPAPGPFQGVPFLVKDAVCHTAGEPYHFGMRALRDAGWTEATDTWLAERFRRAGFVFVGRTNTPEMASSVTTEPLAYGPTRNPWDTSRSTGGSSGGAAAAVASGMVAAAHGNDMGGSIRFPASMCGLVGLKPTRARSTLGPDFGELWGPTTHEHVLTRSVRDSAAILDVIRGPGIGDPYEIAAPTRPYRDEVGAEPGRLRIGFRTARTNGAGASHPGVVESVHATAALLESLGHDVTPDPVTALDDPRLGEAVGACWGAFVAREVNRWSARLGRPIALDELEPANALLVEMADGVSAAAYLGGVEALHGYARGVARWFADFDVLLLPTAPEPALPLGELAPGAGDPFAQLMRLGELITFTLPFNATGQPAVSLPLHMSGDGLPIGVQLVARFGREDVLFRLASQLEQAAPWHSRRPAPG